MTAQTTTAVAEQATPVLGWEQLADKALTNAGNVFEAVSQVISGAVANYGPSVVDAVLWVIRIDHIQPLLYGSMVLIMAIVFWIVWGRRVKKQYLAVGCDVGNMDFGTGLLTFVGGFATLFFVIPFVISTLFNVWNWTAVVKPELWIAKQIVVKIDNMTTSTEKKK